MFDWFIVDKKGGEVDIKLVDMVNLVCIIEGDIEKIIEKYFRFVNCKFLMVFKIYNDIW